MKLRLEAKWLNICTVPGTQQLHCIVLNGLDQLLVAETSDADSFTVVSIRKAEAGINDQDDEEEEDEEGEEDKGTQEDNGRDYGEDDGEFMIDRHDICITVAAEY